MPTLKQIEAQIFAKEGFRVSIAPLAAKGRTVPAYDWEYMASNKWRISDWKMQRLERYWSFAKAIVVYRGDGSIVKSDMRLGNLRDSYFEQRYGERRDNVIELSERRRTSAKKKR